MFDELLRQPVRRIGDDAFNRRRLGLGEEIAHEMKREIALDYVRADRRVAGVAQDLGDRAPPSARIPAPMRQLLSRQQRSRGARRRLVQLVAAIGVLCWPALRSVINSHGLSSFSSCAAIARNPNCRNMFFSRARNARIGSTPGSARTRRTKIRRPVRSFRQLAAVIDEILELAVGVALRLLLCRHP